MIRRSIFLKLTAAAVLLIAGQATVPAFAQAASDNDITVQSSTQSWANQAALALNKKLERFRLTGSQMENGTSAFVAIVKANGEVTDIAPVWSSVNGRQDRAARNALTKLNLASGVDTQTDQPVVFMVQFDTFPSKGVVADRTMNAALRAAKAHFQGRNQLANNLLIIRSGG